MAQLALWLEFADESTVDLNAAVKQQEDLAHKLQQLTADERKEFVRILADVADSNPHPQESSFLRDFPRMVGIT